MAGTSQCHVSWQVNKQQLLLKLLRTNNRRLLWGRSRPWLCVSEQNPSWKCSGVPQIPQHYLHDEKELKLTDQLLKFACGITGDKNTSAQAPATSVHPQKLMFYPPEGALAFNFRRN